MKHVYITNDPLEDASIINLVSDNSHGATVLFKGITRNNTGDREVLFLEYEAYAPMAEKKMAEVAGEVREKWGIERVAMIHRIGKLEIGEVSVAVGVASPHRKDGFEACKYAMDRLKQIVPIWKREVWTDGEEEWVKPDPVYFDTKPNDD